MTWLPLNPLTYASHVLAAPIVGVLTTLGRASRAITRPATSASAKTAESSTLTPTASKRAGLVSTRCPDCKHASYLSFHACKSAGPFQIAASGWPDGTVTLTASPVLYVTLSPALGTFVTGGVRK